MGVIFLELRQSSLGIMDPTTLEALAVMESLALHEDLYVQKIQVASDCKAVVSDILRGTSKYETIITEVVDWSKVFSVCNFCS